MKRYLVLRSNEAPKRTRGGGFTTLSGERGGPALVLESMDERAAAELARDPATRAVAPVMPTRLIKPLSATAGAVGSNWGIPAIGAEASPFTGAGVTVAVLDTGIDRAHPAFAGLDPVERDFSGTGDGDRNGHGTHCAGTIFGRDCGGVRIGVARGVDRVLVGKILDDAGDGESEWVFDALLWALRNSADIISMSIGFDFPGLVKKLVTDGWPVELATSEALEAYRGNLRMLDMIMGVLKAQSAFGVSPLVIAASGNESRRATNAAFRIAASLPSAADDVVSVAAVGQSGERYVVAEFSNSMALVSAPGVDILSAWPGGGLETLSGTSMACPHVAGAAALWWEKIRRSGTKPTAKNVTAQLIATARSDRFADGLDETDVGQGLVTAPKQDRP